MLCEYLPPVNLTELASSSKFAQVMASNDTTQKKRNNYKLLIDPELKKGHKKVYRLNGKDVPGVSVVCSN